MIDASRASAKSFAAASAATPSEQTSTSRAAGASSCTTSATAVPWLLAVEKAPPQKSPLITPAGRRPAACAAASPAKPESMTATVTPAPVIPAACHADAPVARITTLSPDPDSDEPAAGATAAGPQAIATTSAQAADPRAFRLVQPHPWSLMSILASRANARR